MTLKMEVASSSYGKKSRVAVRLPEQFSSQWSTRSLELINRIIMWLHIYVFDAQSSRFRLLGDESLSTVQLLGCGNAGSMV